jgi:hypothetical protein
METPNLESDLDLLLIIPTVLPCHQRSMPIRRLCRPAPCAMDILVYTPEEILYWQGTANHIVTIALQSGLLLYARTTRLLTGSRTTASSIPRSLYSKKLNYYQMLI